MCSALLALQVREVSGKGARVAVWAVDHLAKAMTLNTVSGDKMYQKRLSSWEFVIAHNSELFTMYVFPYLQLIKL